MRIQKHLKSACFWLLLLFIGIVLFSRAARKPFWFDEFVTLAIAQSRFGPEMWQAGSAGFDFNPPAIFVATRLSEMAFGRGPVSSRLPSILSGLIVLFCAFKVSSRGGGAAAGFGVLFLLCFSGAFIYFTEARGYALVMAGVMIAWVSWQDRVYNASHRPLQLLGIFLGLTLALASHMWAIVVPGCFLASAIAHWLRNKTLDVGAVGAMIAPGMVVLSYLPLVAGTRGILLGGEIFKESLNDAYALALTHVPHLLFVFALIFAAHALFFQRNLDNESSQPRSALTPEDTVLALCLVCAPVAIYAITKLMHSAFFPRYALVAALGLTVLLAQLFSYFAQRARTTCYAVLFVLGLGLSAYSIRSVTQSWNAPNPLGPELSSLSQVGGTNEPVIYCSGLDFMQADYYATPEMAARLLYVADRQIARRIIGTDGVDAVYTLGRDYLKLRGRVVSYPELESTYRSFWLVGDSLNPFNWIGEKLREDGADIRALNIPNTRIFHVTLSKSGRVERGNIP